MADLGLIDFKLGLYIKINVNNGQNKFEVHISKNVAKMAILWPKIGQRHFGARASHGHNLAIFHQILTNEHTKMTSSFRRIEWNTILSSISLFYILVFWPHFCSEASHGQCCTYGLKTTLKLLVHVLAIMASSYLKIVFQQKSELNPPPLKECKSFKYLGLMVDNNLKFDIHVDYIKKKIQKRIGAMYRGSSLLPVKYRKMFANSLILPHFDYLDTIYGRASKTKLHELDVLYKKVAKIALGVEKTESSINVYKDMKWLPLHLRRQVHLSSYMLKILNGQSPSNFINKFKFISGGSRDGANCNLYTPKSKNLKNFYYLGAKAWNSLPVDLRNMSDPKVFGKHFKSRLLDSIINDPNYIVNNAYDYIYKLKN